jgi:hypothetical protein
MDAAMRQLAEEIVDREERDVLTRLDVLGRQVAQLRAQVEQLQAQPVPEAPAEPDLGRTWYGRQRLPKWVPCACGCGRTLSRRDNWDGFHGPDIWWGDPRRPR